VETTSVAIAKEKARMQNLTTIIMEKISNKAEITGKDRAKLNRNKRDQTVTKIPENSLITPKVVEITFIRVTVILTLWLLNEDPNNEH